MLDKAKQFGRPLVQPSHLKFSFRRNTKELKADDVKAAREYIAAYWKKLERCHTKDDGSVLGMPKPYLVSSYEEGHDFDFNELYYWDSYFMVQGLLDEEHKELVMGILEDLISLFKRFHTIPNASRTYLTGRSQPPLLSSFIFDVYDAYKLSDSWLKDCLKTAEAEYETVWMGTVKPNARQVYMGMSRYYDINMTHDLAEAESGWDYNPRFSRHCLDYLAVDLNALLYQYEADFARAARIFNDKKAIARWEKALAKRKKTINELMWDQSRGLYYDYNYVKERRGTISSLAGYYPMWAGMADGRQAASMVKALKRFEQKGGLSTTDNVPLGQVVFGAMPVQWAYPNGWAPLQFIVVRALQRYGYHEDARRIAHKWLRTNLDWFNENGVFLEKYNVASPDKPPAKGVYPSQTGFGWTNAVFERFCQEFVDKPRHV
ncbi:MAG TPA: trehalase family glycosidase [Patescibacteria group bacterium]|nr:trehalase family glycosidase [Patescibacteria group bacterium]